MEGFFMYVGRRLVGGNVEFFFFEISFGELVFIVDLGLGLFWGCV